MDAQTRHGITMVVMALAFALLRNPRGRRLLTVLRGALIGVLVGAVVFLAPQAFLILTHPGPVNDLQRWLLKVAVTCGAFYGLTGGATVVAIVFAVSELLLRWRRIQALTHPEAGDGLPEEPPK